MPEVSVSLIAGCLEQALRWFRGLEGEDRIREVLRSHNIHFLQVDALAFANGRWHSIEIKHQESFKPPPFEGHGLPPYQFESRLKLYNEKGIVPWLFVVDANTSEIYYQSMVTLRSLPDAEKYLTKTGTRVVFPISRFKKFNGHLDLTCALK